MTNKNTTTYAACQHDNADALGSPDCGAPQEWTCLDCGAIFTITKPHAVFRYTRHEVGCTHRRVPAPWCVCQVRKGAACVDCGKEFPHSVEPGPGVEVYGA